MDLIINVFGTGFECHISEPVTVVLGIVALGIVALYLWRR